MSNKDAKSKSKFNIYIVEDHNNALDKIYQDIGSKRLKFNNLTMLHFDSHPDLGLPANFDADQVFIKDTLLNSVSIESWILPAVYAGHFKEIIWICPSWCTQIKPGRFDLIIGKHCQTNQIRLNSKQSYFLSDNLYSNEESLINQRHFTLCVVEFEKIFENLEYWKNLNMENVVLDIDLDFFSTQDPFKLMFSNEYEYDVFKRVYKLNDELNENETNFEQKYAEYLLNKKKRLDLILNYLSGKDLNVENEFLRSELKKLSEAIEINKIDLDVLHEYGSGMDETPLPHHKSTESEILNMISKLKRFLDAFFLSKSRPAIVTIARSSLDDYCPRDQVDFIQEKVLECLKLCFDEKEFINKIEFSYEKQKD